MRTREVDPVVRNMGRSYRHQLDVEVGDIIELTAISTTDGWHNQRHALLFNTFTVISKPVQSHLYDGYPYANWVSLEVEPSTKAKATFKRLGTSVFPRTIVFERCQIRLHTKKVEPPFPATMTKREKMLDRINAELNHTEVKDPTNVVGGPQNNYDKKAWKRMYDAGYHIQARKNENVAWYQAGQATFNTRTKRLFRIKPEKKDMPF